MGDTPLPSEPAIAVIVGDAVDDVDEREKSGEEEEGAEGSKVEGAEGSKVETEKKAEADKNTSEGSSTDKKPVKEKTKTAEKRGLKRSGEEPGGGDPKKCKKCTKLQEMVEQLECRLQVEKTKFGVAQDEIVTLNRQNIENRKQLDESTTLVKELTEKIGVGKEEPLGGVERYDPQENEVSTERKDKLWELLREMDDEEMADVIQESTYQSAATAFTEIGFNAIQMIKRLTRPELQASEIPLLVKNTMMRIVDRIGIGTEESSTNKMMPTDWHKIQVSIDLEGRLRKIQWPFAAEFTPSRAMVEYFLKKLKLGKMGNFNPFIYALLNESPWRTYFKDNRKNDDSDARLLLDFGANYGAMGEAIQSYTQVQKLEQSLLKGQEFITPAKWTILRFMSIGAGHIANAWNSHGGTAMMMQFTMLILQVVTKYSVHVAWEYEDQKLKECARKAELGRDTDFDKVSGKLDTDLIQEIRMKLQATEGGGKAKGKGKCGKKDKGKGKNSPSEQGSQLLEWKPEFWKWNGGSEKGHQKGYGKKGKVERKGKEWRTPSPQQQQPPSVSSQCDNRSTAPSLDSLRVKEWDGEKDFFFVCGIFRFLISFLSIACPSIS